MKADRENIYFLRVILISGTADYYALILTPVYLFIRLVGAELFLSFPDTSFSYVKM